MGILFCGCFVNPVNGIKNNSLCYSEDEEGDWEIIVLDPEYESFLLTQQLKEYFTESGLKTKNIFLVSEWNKIYSQPFTYNPSIYSMKIDYDPDENYGLEFEYRLYMFFRFIEQKYKVKF